jgi:hypothetical protein
METGMLRRGVVDLAEEEVVELRRTLLVVLIEIDGLRAIDKLEAIPSGTGLGGERLLVGEPAGMVDQRAYAQEYIGLTRRETVFGDGAGKHAQATSRAGRCTCAQQ